MLLDALEQNVFYDKLATEKMLQYELNNLSQARGLVQKGQVIISQGELITDEKFLALSSYKMNYEGQKLERGLWKLVSFWAATACIRCTHYLFLVPTTISFRYFS